MEGDIEKTEGRRRNHFAARGGPVPVLSTPPTLVQQTEIRK